MELCLKECLKIFSYGVKYNKSSPTHAHTSLKCFIKGLDDPIIYFQNPERERERETDANLKLKTRKAKLLS